MLQCFLMLTVKLISFLYYLSVVIPKDKVSDETPIELLVHARAQWNFTRPSFSKELQPPLSPTNLALLRGSIPLSPASSQLKPSSSKKIVSGNGGLSSSESRNNSAEVRRTNQGQDSANDENQDERWLSHVEITTHSGPHRRLWMGPQFTFKVFNPAR